MAKALFVTGTGTDVGKTYVTALMVKKLAESGENAAYYKAAMSGNRRRSDGSLIPGDAMFVQQTAGLSQPLGEMCPYVYEHAWSPHLAARYEGNPPELPVIRQGFEAVCSRNDYVTVEGSGGILCPLRARRHSCVAASKRDHRGRGSWYHQQRGADGRVYARQKAPCKGNPL